MAYRVSVISAVILVNLLLVMQGISPVIFDLSIAMVLLNRWLLNNERLKPHRSVFILRQFDRYAFFFLLIVNLVFITSKR